MKAIQLNKDVSQLTFLGFSNCFLLREADGLTLIDTSVQGCEKQIVAAARKFGGAIRRILLTHAHGDHMGSLDGLHRLLGNVDVAISEREAPLLRKDLALRPGEPRKKLKPFLFPGAKTQPTHTLTEGELFGSLRCYYTPGHTPGQMSFLDERTGMLIAGDAMISIGGLTSVTQPPWYFPIPKLLSWDLPMAAESVKKLAALQPASVATGHGRFSPDGLAAMARAMAKLGA